MLARRQMSLTRTSHSQSPAPTVDHVTSYEEGLSENETAYFIIVFVTTALVTLFTVFVYDTHPSKDKIWPGDAAVHVWAWMDMVGDVCFVHQLNFHVSNAELIGDAQQQALGIPDQGTLDTLFSIGLAGVVVVSGEAGQGCCAVA